MEKGAIILCLSVWLCLLGAGWTAPSGPFTEDELGQIDSICGEVMACAHIPGLSLGIVRGEHSFSIGHGVADLVTAHPVGEETMFTLGSTAKAFVPYLLAEIMNGKENADGRLKWSSKLGDILKSIAGLDVPQPWAGLTLREMLVYQSGTSAADMSTMAGLPSDVTREELIRRMRFLPKAKSFRTTNHYSNYMYTVAAHIAEMVTDMGWEELVKSRVLDKQDMLTTAFCPEGLSHEDAALPYRTGEGTLDSKLQNASLFQLKPFEPVGSLMASASDVTKWLRHLLHNLAYEGNPSGVNLLIGDAFHTSVPKPDGGRKGGRLSHASEVPFGYGMGWFSSNYRGQGWYSYSGGLYAYQSHIWLFPASSVAVYMSHNGPGTENSLKAVESIMYLVTDVALGLKPWVTPEKACEGIETEGDSYGDPTYYYDEEGGSPVAPQEVNAMTYLAPVSKYVGKFGNGIIGDLEIEEASKGVLVLKLGMNLKAHLKPDSTFENKLKLSAMDPLLNTEEWYGEKIVEFSKDQEDGVFSKVRLHYTDSLFYDFDRNKDFRAMLLEPEIVEVKTTPPPTEPPLPPSTTVAAKEEEDNEHQNDDNNVHPREENEQSNEIDSDKKNEVTGYEIDSKDNDNEPVVKPVKTGDQSRRHTNVESSRSGDKNGGNVCQISSISLISVLVVLLAQLWA